ncbi:MAG: NAD(P)/FAD-dependent oxidoreductase, partial [Bryobacterales bacterium]
MSRPDTDVLIVGGGPAGLATAIAARLQGLDAMVVDAADAPVDKCCGEGILPDGVDALRELGVAIPSDSGRFHGIRFFDADRMAEGRFGDASGFGIRRTLLGQLLLARAGELGVDLRYGARVHGVQGAVVQVDSRRICARWIVGADGFRSHVRRWADLNAGAASQQTRCGFRRHFEVEQAPDFVEVYWREGFQVFVTPVGPRAVGVAMTTGDPAMRLDEALGCLPELACRLGKPLNSERGAVTGNMSL